MTTNSQVVSSKPQAPRSAGSGWMASKTFRRRVQRTVAMTLILIGAVIFMIPFFWMVRTSLMHGGEIFLLPIRWIPSKFLWENYPEALQAVPFLLYFRNSTVVTLSGIIGSVLTSSMVAYAFARLKAPGKETLFIMLLATMMLPGVVTLVPVYLLFRALKWLDTYKPLIVPQYLGGSAFYIFMLRQFFMTIPVELDDAAKIDGCGFFKIYWRLVLPLSKPALATVAVFNFYSNWNDFFGPLIYLNTMEKYTLPVGLTFFVNIRGTTHWNLLMAASVVVLLPCLILFFVGQRYFVQGIALTGIKG
jgi:ABC-type glycerol-3-phosphate transport system permease component